MRDAEQGRISVPDLIGNQLADQAAGGAALKDRHGFDQIASAQVIRQRISDRLVRCIQSMQSDILRQSAKARDPLAKPAKPAAQHIYASFPAGPTDAATGTRPVVRMPCTQDAPRDWSSALRGFVAGNAWTCEQHPCPWLLILLMFERATCCCVTPSNSVNEQHALNATNVGSLLSAFSSGVP